MGGWGVCTGAAQTLGLRGQPEVGGGWEEAGNRGQVKQRSLWWCSAWAGVGSGAVHPFSPIWPMAAPIKLHMGLNPNCSYPRQPMLHSHSHPSSTHQIALPSPGQRRQLPSGQVDERRLGAEASILHSGAEATPP